MHKKYFLYKVTIIVIYAILCFTIYNNTQHTTKKITEYSSIQEKQLNSNKIKKSIEKPYLYLEIDKINLTRPVYNIDSQQNNVEQNIQILTQSPHPNEENSQIILAGHSGTGDNAYFNNIDKLNKNDKISLSYNNNKYIYTIKEIWQEQKNGYIHIKKANHNTLILTTCSKTKGKQLIIMAIQQE
ncbi:MAG: sortase [Bacilli bacterium]|nr:sortase [Bacilli bacterium]